MSRIWMVLLLAAAGLLVANERLSAQEPPTGDQPAAETPPVGAASDDSSPPALRERTIYIPYSRLRSIFERDGRGVFIPYDQFQELWKAARSAARAREARARASAG